MTWVLTITGALLVLLALRDMFHTLWHPRGFGSMGRAVFAAVWWLARRLPSELPGPVGMLAVALLWSLLVLAGWTLIYLPHMPDGFLFGGTAQRDASGDLVTSVYLSLVTVATLGYGDVVPAYPALRLLAPLQALVGFALLTAVISWVLQVYPTLARRRSVARQLSIMAATDTVSFVGEGSVSVVTQLLHGLVDQLTTVRVDLLQYGETYYFREDDPTLSLAANLPYALDLVAAGKRAGSPDVRHLAAMLDQALGDIAGLLEEYVGPHGSVPAVLEAFADDHRQRALRA
jgi:hypothetical protein